ncbi:MAG: chromate efflux transporter [Gemmatimonadaceae bacterium]|nr:chromate efflux transporter [Gemmatimonadaceae bacterium]
MSTSLNAPESTSLSDVAKTFMRLGATAFGGPAAHIAVMEDEFVRRRAWLSSTEFVDLVSASNLIPGPNSTELAMHIGQRRAGWPGLWVAGLAFVLPATILVWGLAMLYVRVGRTPAVLGALGGIQPVVLAVVVHALWRLRTVIGRSALHWTIAVGAAFALVMGVHELLVLALAGVLMALAARLRSKPTTHDALPVLLPAASEHTGMTSFGAGFARTVAALGGAMVLTPPTVTALFVGFLKIGSVLFGSGYVLLALMRAEFVTRQQWLSEGQLLDAIAVGQLTPGPLFSSATFVGFLMLGHVGAIAATVGIFLPAFCFVAISGPLVPRLRRSPTASALLDGVNVGSLAILTAVVLSLIPNVATSALRVASFLVAFALLQRATCSAGWLLAVGAAVGIVGQWLSSP